MSLMDVLKEAGGADITVSIKLNDLRVWTEEMIASKFREKELADREKSNGQFLTPVEVCALLKVSRSSLTRWQKSGYLTPNKVGGKSMYKRSDIDLILTAKKA